ncbi:hydantoinase B/oxoprolinase family protein, partial [Streptomyces cacaoi]
MFPRALTRPGGGSHLPDMVLVTPVFADGRLTAWAANLAHHA